MDYDFVSACVDEIALEGLDGITIPSLWIRLEKRPKFTISLDARSKEFLWKRIALRREIEFYELAEERNPLVLFDRYENVDVDVGIVTEPVNLSEDIYPISIVNESKARGSCATFHSRTNVTQEIVDESGKLKLSLEQAMEKWKEKLVLVAQQNVRTNALLGPYCDPSIELSDMQYVLLERIGRSRYHGEVTQGKMSLAVLKESPKSLHYQRKLLVAAKLVTKQIHYQRSCSGVMVCGSLFHLTRFYVEKKSKFLILLQLICKVLSERPNKTAPIDYLREALGLKEQSWKKILNKHLYQITRVIQLPLKEVKPNLPPEKYFQANGAPKTVRALQLLENVDMSKIGKEDDEDEEEEDDKAEIKDLVKPWIPLLDRPFLHQAIEHLEQIGPDGASVKELARSMNIPYLDSRMLMRNAVRLKAVIPIYKDIGKQRCTKFVPQKHVMKSELRQKIFDEGLKMLKLNEKLCEDDEKPAGSCKNVDEAKEGTSTDGNEVETHDDDIEDAKCGKPDKEKLIDVVKKMEMPEFSFDNSDVTYRKLKRVNIILQMVQQEKLIDNTAVFRKAILTEETKEGVKATVDRHTVRRLIKVLSDERAINVFNTNLTCGEKLVKLQFICDKDVTEHSSIFKSAVEQAKVKKFFAPIPKKSKKLEKSPKKDLDELNDDESIQTGKTTSTTTSTEVKFSRLRLLHEFLFYLIYEYDGKDFNDSSLLWDHKNDGNELSVRRVYKDENSFKRFVPPLPVHADWPTGWCLMSDVILRLPLRLFLKLISCPYKIDELEPYLSNPLKQHYLVCQLEPNVRSVLFSGRRYIFSFSQNAELLARIGLLSFGPQQYKEKEQRFMYLHRTVAVVDTRLSEPSYSQTSSDKEYNKIVFRLNSSADLDDFWQRTQEICLQTPLGCRTSMQTETVSVERVDSKAVMMAACASKTIEEIKDDGTIPGDGRGAGGFDTILYSHLQRNWFNLNKNTGKKTSKNETDVVASTETEEMVSAGYFYKHYLQHSSENLSNSKRLGRLQNRNLTLKTKDKKLEIKVTRKTAQSRAERIQQKRKNDDKSDTKKARKLRKTIQQPTRKIRSNAEKPQRRPYYDEKDKEALKRQSKQRVDWNATEDSFLLLCKVASVLIAPNHYNQLVVVSPFIRDLMLEHIPSSYDKTSRACQRRVMYMMRNPRTKYNVAVYVGEAQQDEELMANVVHPNVPKTDEVAWETAFKKVLLLVLEKFKSARKNYSSLHLPDTIDEFKARFALTSTDALISKKSLELESNNVVSLRFAVVYTLIMSAIFSAAQKDKWAVHLYHLYSDYPDTLLRSVITRLRNDQVIASKKSGSSCALRNRTQLSSLPYRMHIAFENKLRTKYKPAVFEGSRKFYYDLVEKQENGDPCQITFGKGGIAAGVITLLAVGRVKLEIDEFDHLIQFEKDPTVDPPKKRQKCDEQFDSAKGAPSLTRKVSRVHLYMKRLQINESPADSIQHSQDFLIVIPAKVGITLKRNDLAEFGANEGSSGHKMVLPTVDHDYLTDSKCEESDSSVWTPSSKIVDGILNSQLKLAAPKDFDDVLKQNFRYEQEDYFEFSNIYQFISAAKELGVSLQSIKEKFFKCSGISIKQYLDLMLSNGLVLRTGVNVVKFISMTNGGMWMLPKSTHQQMKEKMDKNLMCKRRKSCENDDCDLSNKFVPRPWKMPDGSLNVDMFGTMLRSVLCCIMVNPGMVFRDLVDQLLPTLQAVYALELLEILEEIKCITMIYMEKKKLTLFSTPNDSRRLDKSVGDPFKDKLTFDPNVECLLILENFISNLRSQ